VVGALREAGALASGLHSWKQKRYEHPDDGHDDEQFDKRHGRA
jgi:hypothetical protein